MARRKLLIGLGIGAVVVVGGWALFRPELLFVNKTVNEAFPGTLASLETEFQAAPLLTGSFHSGAHETRGTAAIYEMTGGKRVLRLTGFETSNGPDVRVLLVAAPDAADSDTVKSAGSVELGKLKGNVGDQNYDVPAGTDLARYRAVTIWCNRFGVNFGTAPLTMTGTGMAGTGGGSANAGISAAPAATPLVTGSFHSGAHETRGTAAIYNVAGGQRVLRLTGFETSNGPDVRVLLVAAPDATDNDTVKSAGYVELGKLKGNVGDQNYDVPADLDLARYRAVTIWCNRFSVNFGTAPLGPLAPGKAAG